MRSLLRSFLPALALALVRVPSLVESQILSKESTPTAYHVKIDASNLTTSDTFSGAVLVNMTVESTMTSLILHSENLTLNEPSLVLMKKHFMYPRWDAVPISSLTVNRTWLNISFPAPLANGDYSLYIEYLGYYQSSMTGFAKVGYHFKNDQKYLGVTALEPTNARKVFPCYDTPEYKTQFTLEITVSRPHIAISNIRPTSVHNTSETTRVFLFNNYPAMPVYQLAWAVLDHTSYAVREENSTSILVHTRAPFLYLNQTTWANQLTARLVQAVGIYTGVLFNETTKQTSSKIEQVVLPEFFLGTSEGYGFMSFSEESILVSPSKSSTKYIQDVALTLARGVVQQWFGDIVSVGSWDNIWLMKGLDQFLQYVIAESLSDMADWELGDQAVVELTQPALALDSPDSHPLKVTTTDETELVTTVYDSLTKYKGGAIIRMLGDVFGSSFKEAMHMFISGSYSNPKFNPTTPSNFWDILYEIASDRNIDLAKQSLAKIMQQWITAPGYPVLSVTSNTSHFVISQPSTSQWWVPVSYSIQGSPNVSKVWLEPGSYFTVQGSSAKWILLNLNQTGFYRVNYTSALWQALSTQLRTDLTQLPRLSRAQLIDEAFSADPQMALEFTSFLRAETDYFPWFTALRHYQNLIYSLAGHSSYELLQNYVLDLMNGVIAGIGFSPRLQDTHVDRLKRSLVLEKACQFGHQNCIQKAVTNLRTWMAQTYYDADLSPALLCAGVANSSTEVWHNVWSMYQYSLFPSVRLALLQSLTCTQDKRLLYEFLNNITSTSDPVVSVKDKTIILQTLSSKPFGAHILLNWLVDRLQAQTNGSSAGTTTPIPGSSTPEPEPSSNSSPTIPSPTTPIPTITSPTTPSPTIPSSNQTSDQQGGARLAPSSTPGTMKPIEKLPESDIVAILNLILPMLTTLEEGTKLDSFLALGNTTELSNDTLETMRSATQQIYMQAGKVMKLNAKLTTWLEAEAAATTTATGGTTTATQPPQPPKSTPAPSSALRSAYGTTALLTCLLAMFLHVQAMV